MTAERFYREPLPWYADHANLVMLTRYLVDGGWSADSIADAVEKPAKYEPEYRAAQAVADHERAFPLHCPRPSHEVQNAWYCEASGSGDLCDWTYLPNEGAT